MNIFSHLGALTLEAEAIYLILTFTLFAIIGVLIVRKVTHREKLKEHHDVAGFVFTNFGLLYAVLLGFTVVIVQQRFDKIKEVTQLEASYLSELYRDAEVFSQKDREAIRNSIKKYAEYVLKEEWELMRTNARSANSVTPLENLWKSYYAVNLSQKTQEIWYAESVNKLNGLVNTRISRLLGSEESLGPHMWTFLIVGGMMMVTFVWFFGIESLTSHILMITTLASATAFLLFLIYSLDTAYVGEISIQPELLTEVLTSFH